MSSKQSKMIYLDNAATTMRKPQQVAEAVHHALLLSGSAGRSSHKAASFAAQTVYDCRCELADLFGHSPERVIFTFNATHGLNIAIKSLIEKGDRVVISGFEHNAVLRPLFAIGAEIVTAGRKLFDWEDTIASFEAQINEKTKAVICTHVSNVFGYILPIHEISKICKRYHVPLIVDAAQSAGIIPLSMKELDAEFIAMPGHKGLFGPQGTGVLLCKSTAKPLIEGGTGSRSKSAWMPELLPDRLEAGTMNTHGIAGLLEGVRYVKRRIGSINQHDTMLKNRLRAQLTNERVELFAADTLQSGVISMCFDDISCEELGNLLSEHGIAVRAGFHCAPLAHQSAGTYETGTVRVSVSALTEAWEIDRFCEFVNNLKW